MHSYPPTRGFSYEHEGQEHFVDVPSMEHLTLPGDDTKAVHRFDDGEAGLGRIEIRGTVYYKILTCIEP